MSENKITSNCPLPDEAISAIVSVLDTHIILEEPSKKKDLLFLACKKIAEIYNMPITAPFKHTDEITTSQYIELFSENTPCRVRKVRLEDNWWKKDNSVLLAFYHKKPCVLIPSWFGYRLWDPESTRSSKLTPTLAKAIGKEAYYFYKTLPPEPLRWKNIIRFAFQGFGMDLRRIFLMQILIALSGLFIPIATGVLFDYVVPNADFSLLRQFVTALLINVFAITAFSIAQVIGLIRIQSNTNIRMQSAIWDRLLRLPTQIFHEYTAGDLTLRASSADRIQQAVTSSILLSLVSGALSIITLFFMLYYDSILTLGVVVLVFILLFIQLIMIKSQLNYQRHLNHIQGKLAGFVFQLLNNITQIRIGHHESSVFTVWSKKFSEASNYFLKSSAITIRLTVFQVTFSVISTAILFMMVMGRGQALSFGSFIIFNAAFVQFMASLFSMVSSASNIIQIIPLYERAQPILDLFPKNEEEKIDPGKLSGDIKLSHVFFHYPSEVKPTLKNVSLSVKPRQFVAIVGPSGSGKSTLIRLLLGFETAHTGHILYDKQDLSILNIRLVRKQLGVVLQDSALLPGTILENITGSSTFSKKIEKAWEVAEKASIAEDIRNMPMEMHTLVSESGKTLSMGQRQRLLLARALMNDPQILLLDEATSNIDQATQSTIYHNLEKLQISKVIVTHRLNTLKQADQIYVLHQGEIIQQGNYESLIKEKNLFAELIQRQIVS